MGFGRSRSRAVGEATAERAQSSLVAVAVFALLGSFAATHWFRLVADAPAGRIVAAVGVATALAALLTVLGRSALPRPAVHIGALLGVLGAGALALVVTGLPARLLGPRSWGEFAGELDRGLAGVRTVQWPYAGPEEWVGLVILLGAPLLLTVAAALTFWPVRRAAGVLRALGLVVLLALYGVPVTEHDPGAPLLRGFMLLAMVAAWLWLPRLRGREAAVAAAVVLAVGVGALPVAAKLDSDTALVDYRSWQFFGGGKDITFNFNHSYGPLDWPRKGTTLLDVESEEPLYWKVETLDAFDGLRWLRSDANERSEPGGELPAEPDARWDETFRVTVRSLRTDFVVGAGTPYAVVGAGEAVTGSADGTVRRLDEPLQRDDSYTVRSYVPNPGPERMRAADPAYPTGLDQYTRIDLPLAGETALPEGRRYGPGVERAAVIVPLRGGDPAGAIEADGLLGDSPYAKTHALARRLTAGAPTVYDAVDRVRKYLLTRYTYSERPPTQAYPLEAFLFEDKIGYCQQFSGAMALMLRMSGIPTRVVSGFSPGSLDKDTGEFRVRDLDAHSWVEVYFNDIGWVTFDPTPRASPADRAGLGPEAERLDIPTGGETRLGGGAGPIPDRGGDPTATAEGSAGAQEGGLPVLPVVLVLFLAAGAAALVLRRRLRRGPGLPPADAGLRELERALPRLGWSLGPGTTLLELERRLACAAGPESAGYVARLREGRFSPRGARLPGRADRAALRRELTAAGGLRARLRGFSALPPGGPRTS
jgi:transglutaminase-like putative cysteine protease